MADCDQKEEDIVLQVALEELELELTPDGQYVRWANTNRNHPRNWPTIRKVYDIGLIIFLEFYTYSLAQAIGNIVFPPYSEAFGRKKLYILSTALFSIFSVLIAAVPSLGAMVAGRTLTGLVSSVPTVIITGSIEDMFNARDRIWLVFAYMVVANFAVNMGPVMSGYIM